MQIITIQQYQTTDGQIFTDAAAAVAHDAALKAKQGIDAYIAALEVGERTRALLLGHLTNYVKSVAAATTPVAPPAANDDTADADEPVTPPQNVEGSMLDDEIDA